MISSNFQQMAHTTEKMGIFKTTFQTPFVFTIVTLPFLVITNSTWEDKHESR